jgi:hypothetical protein
MYSTVHLPWDFSCVWITISRLVSVNLLHISLCTMHMYMYSKVPYAGPTVHTNLNPLLVERAINTFLVILG